MVATGVAMSVATEIDIDAVVKNGAIAASCYLIPVTPLYMYVKKYDKAIAAGIRAAKSVPRIYKFAKKFTSPIEFFNYVSATGIRRFGITEAMKSYCGVVIRKALVNGAHLQRISPV